MYRAFPWCINTWSSGMLHLRRWQWGNTLRYRYQTTVQSYLPVWHECNYLFIPKKIGAELVNLGQENGLLGFLIILGELHKMISFVFCQTKLWPTESSAMWRIRSVITVTAEGIACGWLLYGDVASILDNKGSFYQVIITGVMAWISNHIPYFYADVLPCPKLSVC